MIENWVLLFFRWIHSNLVSYLQYYWYLFRSLAFWKKKKVFGPCLECSVLLLTEIDSCLSRIYIEMTPVSPRFTQKLFLSLHDLHRNDSCFSKTYTKINSSSTTMQSCFFSPIITCHHHIYIYFAVFVLVTKAIYTICSLIYFLKRVRHRLRHFIIAIIVIHFTVAIAYDKSHCIWPQ